jgi:hypothetical protein
MLVDPPLSSTIKFLVLEEGSTKAVMMDGQLFQGGYEDFLPPDPDRTLAEKRSQRTLKRWGMFEDMIFYWTRVISPDFGFEQPSVVQLSQYGLRMIAAEWVNYETLMNITAKEFEYTIPNTPDTYLEIEKLNTNMKSLQSWMRRRRASLTKLQSVIELLQNEKGDSEGRNSLLEDYKHLSLSIEHYGHRLESMLPMVASFVQIIDTRRSFAETANISRLTYLAIIFVPLSYVTGIFSMNPDVGPGGSHFWVYFVVSVPLSILVFLIARPPTREVRSLQSRSGKAHKRRPGPNLV